MANDIDMENDLEMLDKRTAVYEDLFNCYEARFLEGDIPRAEKLKQEFIEKHKTWGNYY